MTSHDPALAERVREILNTMKGMEGPLLPILHAVQAEFGHVPQGAIPLIAEGLNLTRAEVHGVVSFYHDYRDHPAPAHSLRLCRAEACQAQGADRLADHAKAKLGVDWHGQADGIALEPVFCLGLCACGPAAQVDGQLVGRLDAAKLDELIGGMR